MLLILVAPSVFLQDVNCDGYDDVVVGAFGAEPDGRYRDFRKNQSRQRRWQIVQTGGGRYRFPPLLELAKPSAASHVESFEIQGGLEFDSDLPRVSCASCQA